jgi:hypothetical protein
MSNETTTERLTEILATIEDAPLREDLFNRFWLLDPLQYARALHSLEMADSVKAQLLSLKVGQPPQHKGTDLAPLIERSMQIFWETLADRARELNLTL